MSQRGNNQLIKQAIRWLDSSSPDDTDAIRMAVEATIRNIQNDNARVSNTAVANLLEMHRVGLIDLDD